MWQQPEWLPAINDPIDQTGRWTSVLGYWMRCPLRRPADWMREVLGVVDALGRVSTHFDSTSMVSVR